MAAVAAVAAVASRNFGRPWCEIVFPKVPRLPIELLCLEISTIHCNCYLSNNPIQESS